MIRKALLAAFVLSPALLHAQAKLLRYPTYSKGKVAFSYLGDIWIANENGSGLERLTDNQARDTYPRFSPDGNSIAFSSSRAGNYDVYVIPAGGGKPRQLTFHSADDIVVGWTPDGRSIVFYSNRGNGAFPTVSTLFEVSAQGGLERPLDIDWGAWGSFSPDGSKLAFTRHPSVWSRQHYRGSYSADLWVMDVAAKKFTKLGDEDYKGNYLWPMYGHDGDIYYVADELPNEKNIKFGGPEVMKSVNNIWKIPEKGGKPAPVTHHTDGNLFFPSMSADGETIVYEDNFGLWKLDVASGKSTEIRIDIKSDVKENEVALAGISNEADSFHLSPSTKRAAIAVHGEIFTIATDRGEVQRVTESAWRDEDPRWSPDGKWIAFISDRSGREEIWIADELGRNLKKLTDVDSEKAAPVWSPDSKSLLVFGSEHKLRLLNVETGATEILASNPKGDIDSAQFSPDGKWVSYAKDDAAGRSRVYVKELATGTEHLIGGEDISIATGAKWTPDGKTLLFLGGVGAPSMASLSDAPMQLYAAPLQPVERNPDDRDIDTEAQANAPPEAGGGTGNGRGSGRGGFGRGGGGGGGRNAEASGTEVKIDWDGLDRRIKQVVRVAGSVSGVNPSPDGRIYALVSGGAVYTVVDDGSRLTRVQVNANGEDGGGGRGGFRGGSGQPQWSKDGRSLYFLQRGSLYTANIPPAPAGGGGSGDANADNGGGGGRGGGRGGAQGAPAAAGPTARRVPFTVRMEIDQAAERKQVFEEAWRTMKYRYYDAGMHGVNWEAQKDIYETLLPNVADVDELHNVIMMMIGKLNSSHTGISGGGLIPGQQAPERVQTRYPGFEMEPDPSGYFKVSYIYQKGPADHDYVKLRVGDYVLSVNGKDLKSGDNYWQYFNELPGRKFEFTVSSKPELDGAWNLSVDPISQTQQDNLEYDRWADQRKAMVDKLSGGQIGYLHIREMNAAALRKFQRDLLENQDKKALIIDERFNGGGGIDQELLQILNQRKKYQVTRGRDSVDVPRPSEAYFGPMVVLQNERSASDAEMFPEGFRALGLGKVIGVPTYGAVIGADSYRLLDGSQLRTPEFGVFSADGRDLENYGVPPDVYADNTPADFLAGHDRQIEKAIEVLQSEMK
ncbi:MAG TPA: S41 family peptidase [Bryobacteraceae bacterium]|nr:S41 family peptidase [Bryobacteraceae bacterium]